MVVVVSGHDQGRYVLLVVEWVVLTSCSDVLEQGKKYFSFVECYCRWV